MKLAFKTLRDGIRMPKKAHLNDAGYDVYMPEDITIVPGKNVIPMGFSIVLPVGTCALLTPRSSFMGKLVNSAVPIDPGYSGEWHLCINNVSGEAFEVKKGERIAQIIFLNYSDVDFVDEDQYEFYSRGSGGLGSSGK